MLNESIIKQTNDINLENAKRDMYIHMYITEVENDLAYIHL